MWPLELESLALSTGTIGHWIYDLGQDTGAHQDPVSSHGKLEQE